MRGIGVNFRHPSAATLITVLETLLACIELEMQRADASGGNYAKNEEARIRYEDMRDDEDGMA